MFNWLWFIVALFINIGTIDDLAKWSYQSPEKLSWYLEQRTEYMERDSWDIDVELLIKEKKFDCKGYSAVFLTVLNKWGVKWEQKILTVRAPFKAHAVCVFWYKNQYCYFGGSGGIVYTGTTNIYNVPSMVYENWISWKLYEDAKATVILEKGEVVIESYK